MPNKYDTIMKRICADFFKRHLPLESATEEQLKEVEALIGHSLPTDYREFLRDYGGYIINADYPVQAEGQIRYECVSNFYRAAPQPSAIVDGYRTCLEVYEPDPWIVDLYPGLSLVRSMEGIEELGWPEELFPIADSGGGSQICLALFGLRPGAIFFWRNSPHFGENLYLVADSFDEFMHLLQG